MAGARLLYEHHTWTDASNMELQIKTEGTASLLFEGNVHIWPQPRTMSVSDCLAAAAARTKTAKAKAESAETLTRKRSRGPEAQRRGWSPDPFFKFPPSFIYARDLEVAAAT